MIVRRSFYQLWCIGFAGCLIVSSSCKPRLANRADLSSVEARKAYQDEQNTIATILLKSSQYSTKPLFEEGMENFKDGKHQVKRPDTMQSGLFDKDPRWAHPFIGSLVTYMNVQSFNVRVVALQHLVRMGALHEMTGWQEVVNEELPHVFYGREQTGDKFKVCSSYLACSQALEALAVLANYLRSSQNFDQVIKDIQADIQHFVKTPVIGDVLLYRYNTLVNYKKFITKTGLYLVESQGRSLSVTAEDVEEMKKPLTCEISTGKRFYQFAQLDPRKNKNDLVFNNTFRDYFLRQFLDVIAEENKKSIFDLKKDESEFAQSLGYVSSVLDTVTEAYVFNYGMMLNLERFRSGDTLRWLNSIVSRATAYQKQSENNILDQWRGGGKTFQLAETADVNKTDSSVPASALCGNEDYLDTTSPIDPYVAFTAVTMFFNHDVFLPYRDDFIRASEQLQRMMPIELLDRGTQALTSMKTAVYAYQKKASTYGSITQHRETLPLLNDKQQGELKKVFQTLQRLQNREKEIASSPKMVGFQSMHLQMSELRKRLVRRTLATQKLTDFYKPKEGDADRFLTERDWIEINRVLWAPDTGSQGIKFEIKEEHYWTISQWLVITCVDRMFNPQASLDVNGEFFLDGTPLNFRCDRREDFGTLKRRSFQYASQRNIKEVEADLKKSIRDHPFLHTAMMLGVGSVMVSPTMMALTRGLQLLSTAGAIPIWAQAVFAAQGVARVSSLVMESYLFGVAEYIASDIVDKSIGVEKPIWEKHDTPWFNLGGTLQGFVVFGLLPISHHASDYLVGQPVRALLGKNILSFLLGFASDVTFEGGFFYLQPMIVQEGYRIYNELKGETQIVTELEKQVALMHGESQGQRIVNSLITATVFNVNRHAGMRLRNLQTKEGIPLEIKELLAYQRMKAAVERGDFEKTAPENLYRTVIVPRSANRQEILDTLLYHRNRLIDTIAVRQQMGETFTEEFLNANKAEYEKIDSAAKILLGEPGWAQFVTKYPERAYLLQGEGQPRERLDQVLYGKREQGKASFEMGDHDRDYAQNLNVLPEINVVQRINNVLRASERPAKQE